MNGSRRNITENCSMSIEQVNSELDDEAKQSAEQDKYSPTELSNYDNHPAVASELYQVEMNTASCTRKTYCRIKMLLQRLIRVFGYCEKCGEEIPPERLQAVPYARMCLRCKNETEAAPKNKFKEGQRGTCS